MAEFDAAKDKIMMGAERKSMVMSEHEKEMTAYHEAGHAIVGRLVPEHDPVYKVSIIPRGRALGVTMYLPEQDRVSHSKEHLESMLSSLYGGRIAEALIYGDDKVTTGASNDIERATDIAKKMVTQWGLSPKLGPQMYMEEQGEMYMGGGSHRMSGMSDETAKLIDAEIKDFITRNYQRAEQILKDNMDILHSMKDALMKYETIDAGQIDDLMARQDVRPPRDAHDQKPEQKNKVETKPEVKSEPEVKDSEPSSSATNELDNSKE
jgi:cell division protease FtsH